MLDILEDYCKYKNLNFVRLDGDTEMDEREKNIENFSKDQS